MSSMEYSAGYCEVCSTRILYSPTRITKSYCAKCDNNVKVLSQEEIYERDTLRLRNQLSRLTKQYELKIQSHMEKRGSYDTATIPEILETLERNVINLTFYSKSYHAEGDDDHLAYSRVEGADVIALVLMLVDKLERKKYESDREESNSST